MFPRFSCRILMRSVTATHCRRLCYASGNDEISTSGDDPQRLSFFEGGSGYDSIRVSRRKDPLNVKDAEVPWVDDWYQTKQGFARVQLLAKKTGLSVDETQKRISQLLSIAPGLQKLMPLLHPTLFSTIIAKISHSNQIMTMLKSELPDIDLGIVVAGFPRVLVWDKNLLYKCLCFFVVHYKGRHGAAKALNESPMRLKFCRQLIDVLFYDEAEMDSESREPVLRGRLYQFHKNRKKSNPPQNKIVYFQMTPTLRE